MPRIALLSVLAVTLAVTACGPISATDDGGAAADPVALLSILPSPGALRGPPAAPADPAALARAFTGRDDPQLASVIRSRAPKTAGVRTWAGPGGQTLTATVTVWDSHLTATQAATDLAERLVNDGGRAWTPPGAGAARGARRDGGPARELRLGRSVGPNTLYVRATGPVPDDVVITALRRLSLPLEEGATITRTEAG